MEYTNKTVIITGGATGIGRETARAFLERGANVVLNGRREMKLQEAITEIDQTGKREAYMADDISKPETTRQLIRTAVQLSASVITAFGGVGIFPNQSHRACSSHPLQHWAGSPLYSLSALNERGWNEGGFVPSSGCHRLFRRLSQ